MESLFQTLLDLLLDLTKGQAIRSAKLIWFGFIEVGTVTPKAHQEIPKKVFRLRKDKYQRMGIIPWLEATVKNLKTERVKLLLVGILVKTL